MASGQKLSLNQLRGPFMGVPKNAIPMVGRWQHMEFKDMDPYALGATELKCWSKSLGEAAGLTEEDAASGRIKCELVPGYKPHWPSYERVYVEGKQVRLLTYEFWGSNIDITCRLSVYRLLKRMVETGLDDFEKLPRATRDWFLQFKSEELPAAIDLMFKSLAYELSGGKMLYAATMDEVEGVIILLKDYPTWKGLLKVPPELFVPARDRLKSEGFVE